MQERQNLHLKNVETFLPIDSHTRTVFDGDQPIKLLQLLLDSFLIYFFFNLRLVM